MRRSTTVAALATLHLAAVALLLFAPTVVSECPAGAISAGDHHTCAVLADGVAKCWGGNLYGQLGYGDTRQRGDGAGEMGSGLPAINVGAGRTVVSISTGYYHSCVVLDNGVAKCWGDNRFGQLGYGDTEDRGDDAGEMGTSLPAIDVGFGRTVLSIAAGDDHTCVVLDNGVAKCFGDNSYYQLGYADGGDRGDGAGEMGASLPAIDLGQVVVSISAGDLHTCAVLSDRSARCWGKNDVGQLGYGDTTSRAALVWDGARLSAIDLGREVMSISAGSSHTCVVLINGDAKCFGYNYYGQLGYGDTANRGDYEDEMGSALSAIAVGSGRTVLSISAGLWHTCVVLDNGVAKCWGDNGRGRLGYGDTINRGDGPGEMGWALSEIAVGAGRTVVSISAGSAHTCALLDDLFVKCWGANNDWGSTYGRLGYGDGVDRGDEPGEMGDALPAVSLCETCPANSESSSGSALCRCSAGFTGAAGGPCSACEAGTYKATAGSASCAACTGSSSAAGSAGCASCDAGYTRDDAGSSGVGAVQCGGSCGCWPSLAPGGVISDGAGSYSNYDECWWIISGDNPSVTFTSFDIEPTFDNLYVEECGDAACSWGGVLELAALSGTPALATYAATGQHLRVRFTSDSSGTRSGFTASWRSELFGPCDACMAGTYKAVAGSGTCTACPSRSSSAVGSDERADCACAIGYTAASDGVSCVECFDCDSVVSFTATVTTIDRADFTSRKQYDYMAGVAQALAVAPARVAIASITDPSSRRLLAVSVLTKVTVPKDKAAGVAALVTAANLNRALASRTASGASDISVLVVSTPEILDPETAGRISIVVLVLVPIGGAAFLLALAVMSYYGHKSRRAQQDQFVGPGVELPSLEAPRAQDPPVPSFHTTMPANTGGAGLLAPPTPRTWNLRRRCAHPWPTRWASSNTPSRQPLAKCRPRASSARSWTTDRSSRARRASLLRSLRPSRRRTCLPRAVCCRRRGGMPRLFCSQRSRTLRRRARLPRSRLPVGSSATSAISAGPGLPRKPPSAGAAAGRSEPLDRGEERRYPLSA